MVVAMGTDHPPLYSVDIIRRIGDVKKFISWTVWDVQVFIRETGQLLEDTTDIPLHQLT